MSQTQKALNRMRLLVHSASQLVCVVSGGERRLEGCKMKDIVVNSAEKGESTFSVAIDGNGVICCAGTDEEVELRYPRECFDEVIDATGNCVMPGLVDAHTHPVWAGDRVEEFRMKLAGATYMDIHKLGGGIHYTVAKTRAANEQDLCNSLYDRLLAMMRSGSTLVECKTGYGLDLETEMKMLRTIENVREKVPLDLTCTYLAAHAIPLNKTAGDATDDIVSVQLPEIKKQMDKGEIRVDQIDVFCETGVFDLEQTAKILEAGNKYGLGLNFHGEELTNLGSPEMAARYDTTAISHLEEISTEGISSMARGKIVAVILPTTALLLKLKPPPVRDMIQEGVAVALGSDFNPNAYTYSMPMVMYLACVTLGMTMEEALAAATINAAASLGRADTHGSIEVGKIANILVIHPHRWEHLIYRFGCHDDVVKYVIHRGRIVHTNKRQ